MLNRSAFVRLVTILAVAGSTISSTLAQNEDVVALPKRDAQPATQPAAGQPATTPATPATTPAPAAAAGQPDPKAEARRLAGLLEDFIHWTKVHNFELAAANAQALLDSGITDEQFTAMVDDNATVVNRFLDAVIKGQTHPEIERLAASLLEKYNKGRLAHARDAGEISRNIELLGGTQQERMFATDRLLEAGEYAMPQLFTALLDRADPVRQSHVRRVVVAMSRHAIIPLCSTLDKLEPNNQELVVGVLGDLVNPYTTSLPFLYELWSATGSARVKDATAKAIQRIAGAVNPEIPVTTRFETLAVEYYNESESVTNFKGEDVQLLWNFDPGAGLFATPIKTEVYHEAMAMRLSERALRHTATNSEALALWIASNFSREIDSPEGYANPAYPESRRDATYYAVAAGPSVCERVLARSIDDRDTPLARRSIAAIEKTAGADAMITTGVTTRRPLLEAVAYPSRRVQYDAALAVGAAQPSSDFPGSNRIVPVLASAIRDASARYALILSDNPADQGALSKMLEDRGYSVLPPGRSLSEVAQSIAESPGLDLIITSGLPGPNTDQIIQEVRARPGLAATPVLSIVSLQAYLELGKKYDDDAATRISREGVSNEQIATAADQLIEGAVGGQISEEEAREYKLRALSVLRDLAVSGNDVLKISFASAPLVTAIGTDDGPVRLRIAEVLSYIDDKAVQVAMMDAAIAAGGEDQIALLGHVANSAKRFGNKLEARQINALLQLAKDASTDAEATAAAALMGALKLPNKDLIPLILGETK